VRSLSRRPGKGYHNAGQSLSCSSYDGVSCLRKSSSKHAKTRIIRLKFVTIPDIIRLEIVSGYSAVSITKDLYSDFPYPVLLLGYEQDQG